MSMKKEVTSRTIAGIITGIVLAIIFAAWGFISGFFTTTIPGWIGGFFGWLGDDVIVSRWGLYAWRLVALCGVAWLVAKFVAAVRAPIEPPEPTWRDYKADQFYGMRWRWNYTGNTIYRADLQPYCPQCDRSLEIRPTGAYHTRTTYVCQKCGVIEQANDTHDDVLVQVLREIDVKNRNGEWRDALRI